MLKKQLKTIGQGVWVEIYKERVKSHFDNPQHHSTQKTISSQMTNNYMTEPTSPNPYITRKLNNMDKAKKFKKEWDNLTRLYYKTLKGLEAMINI